MFSPGCGGGKPLRLPGLPLTVRQTPPPVSLKITPAHSFSLYLLSISLISSLLFSSSLISSQCLSSPLISSHLLSSHLIFSHLTSSHLLSSPLISPHFLSFFLILSHLNSKSAQVLRNPIFTILCGPPTTLDQAQNR